MLFVLFFLVANIFAQYAFIKNGYFSPLDTTIALAGGFGELRNGHLHAGLDIRTFEKEGLPIYSIQKASVKRILVSPWGYGNAIYLEHPSGYYSLYAHLSKFAKPIEDFVKQIQYTQKTFKIDTTFDVPIFSLEGGDIIGYSGNTGFSSGPHLHFEIRKNNMQTAINPFLTHFVFSTKTSPSIKKILIYAVDTISLERSIKNTLNNKVNDLIVKVPEVWSIGIQTQDLAPNYKFKLPIYSIKVYINQSLLCYISQDSFNFSTRGFLNEYRDYYLFATSNIQAIQCINPFAIYNNSPLIPTFYKGTKGVFSTPHNECHKVTIEVCNAANICTKKSFTACGDSNLNIKTTLENYNIQPFTDTILYSEGMKVKIFKTSLAKKASLFINRNNNTWLLGKPFTPFIDSIKVYLPPLSPEKIDKQIIGICPNCSLDNASNFKPLPTKIENGLLTATSMNTGVYKVIYDTTPPLISYPKKKKHIAYKMNDVITFNVKDNFSGIQKIDCFLNNQWCLCEYNGYNYQVSLPLDYYLFKYLSPPLNQKILLTIIAYDNVGNVSKFNTYIIIKE